MNGVGRWTVAALLLLAVAQAASAQTRTLERVELQPLSRSGEGSETALPLGHWSLLVVRDGRRESRDLLSTLNRLERLPPGLAIVVLGDREGAQRLRALQPGLAALPWRVAAARDVMLELDLAGTPTLLGIDAAGTVRWQRPGDPQTRLEQWLERVQAWHQRGVDGQPAEAAQ